MQKKNKIPLFLLYFFFLFPLILSIILKAPSSSVIVSGSLSIRNYGELFAFTLCSIYVLLNSKYIFENYFKSKFLKPFFILVLLYYSSTIWSEYKFFTLFRTSEFLVIGILSLIVYNNFSTDRKNINLTGLRKYLFNIVIIGMIYVFLSKLAFYRISLEFNILRDNVLSLLIAGSFLISFYHHFFLKNKNRLLFFLFFAFIFISNSLTSIFALILSLMFLYLCRFKNNLKYYFIILTLSLMIFHFYLGGIGILNEFLSKVSSRPIESISNLTGREIIWKLILFELKDNYFGSGFATDMFILVDKYNRKMIGTISSGHSVYLESYISAKWLGVIILLYSFYFWFKNAKNYFPDNYYNLIHSLIFFTLISNFTNPGYGGSLVSSPYMLFWVTLTPLITFNKKNNNM